MSRCVVFDQATGDRLASHLGGKVEAHGGNSGRPEEVIALAIAAPGASAAVVPGDGESALLIRFTRPTRPAETVRIESTRLAPSGFLGLSDELELEPEPEPPKKWWQRILD